MRHPRQRLMLIAIAAAAATLSAQALTGRENLGEVRDRPPAARSDAGASDPSLAQASGEDDKEAGSASPGTPDLSWDPDGAPVVLYFDFDKDRLTDDGLSRLSQMLGSLRRQQVSKVELIGHADRAGPASYNERLAAKRAEAVAETFKTCGIDAEALDINQKGETMPAVATPDGAPEPRNRRVEIAVSLDEAGQNGSASAPLPPISEERTFVIYFELDDARLDERAKAELGAMLAYADRMAAGNLEISGHADRIGPKDYNRQLSLERADTVAKTIWTCGYGFERLDITSHGEDEPAVATADGVKERRNRRVEITIRPVS